jgi:indolepyruvate ferredoxin oxidoreductase, beta subunit
MYRENKPSSVIVAGVGGQGAITVSQLILGAAWKTGYYVLQSEVHGMSQRGGSVNAQILFDKKEVTSPVIMEGRGDLLIGLEPLETLRYLSLLDEGASVISSISTVKNMADYPEIGGIIDELKKIPGVLLVDTDKLSVELGNKNAGNMILLGAASKHLPFENNIWYEVIKERFDGKPEELIKKNIEAFERGKRL